MILKPEDTEEIRNVKHAKSKKKEWNALVKKFRKSGKPFCERCLKDDWNNNTYNEDDTRVYFMMTKLKDDEIVNKTRMGTKIVSPFSDYECNRGHGLTIFHEEVMIAPAFKSHEVKTQGSGGKKE